MVGKKVGKKSKKLMDEINISFSIQQSMGQIWIMFGFS